jgi:hypothetical protein
MLDPERHVRSFPGGILPGADEVARVYTSGRRVSSTLPARTRVYGGPAPSKMLPDYRGLCRRRPSSPTIPRRKVSTHTTKMSPWTMVTQEPSWAR